MNAREFGTRTSLAIAVAAIGLAIPQSARADKLLLIMDFGAPENKRIESVQSQLQGAEHELVVAGSSLEDTALLLGCEASEDACMDEVISTGNVDGLIVLPSDEGGIMVRRGSANVTIAVTPEEGFDAAISSLVSALTPVPAPNPKGEVGTGPDGTASTEVGAEPVGPVESTEPSASTGAVLVEAGPQNDRFSVGRVKTRTWIVLGGGVVATGLGLGFLAVASSKQDEVDTHPVDTAADLDALRDLEDSGSRFTNAGNLFAVVGGVAVLTGVGLALWDSKQGRTPAKTTIIPTASADGFGVALQWTGP